MLAAVEAGAALLGERGLALDAVVAAVTLLENDPLFNASFGSVLTSEGKVEMDAAVATTALSGENREARQLRIYSGGVVLISRVRNPIRLARAVMELTPHMLMAGAGAEHLARQARIPLCRPEALVSQRARARWMTQRQQIAHPQSTHQHGTVGAAALDVRGNLAAATSTGGIAGKLPGRIGDSALFGAGLYVDREGAASATGMGEPIMRIALCRDVIERLRRKSPTEAAQLSIEHLHQLTTGEAGVIMVDRRGRFGYAHNALAMEIATFDQVDGVRHLLAPALGFDD
jgi:beta-aspartyl-peptidase (threonine type)